MASFMQMYPAYKLRDVLNEYAVIFFTLLNEGYRLRYAHYMMLSQIADLPGLDKENRKKFYRNLEWASTHPADIMKPSGEGATPAEIKKILGG